MVDVDVNRKADLEWSQDSSHPDTDVKHAVHSLHMTHGILLGIKPGTPARRELVAHVLASRKTATFA